MGLPGDPVVENPPTSAGDMSSISGSGSPGEGTHPAKVHLPKEQPSVYQSQLHTSWLGLQSTPQAGPDLQNLLISQITLIGIWLTSSGPLPNHSDWDLGTS